MHAPLAPARTRSSMSARNGATPVPGPTMMSGGVPTGSLSWPDVSKRIGRREPARASTRAKVSSRWGEKGGEGEGQTHRRGGSRGTSS